MRVPDDKKFYFGYNSKKKRIVFATISCDGMCVCSLPCAPCSCRCPSTRNGKGPGGVVQSVNQPPVLRAKRDHNVIVDVYPTYRVFPLETPALQ